MQWGACNGAHAMGRMPWGACNGAHAMGRMPWGACNGAHGSDDSQPAAGGRGRGDLGGWDGLARTEASLDEHGEARATLTKPVTEVPNVPAGGSRFARLDDVLLPEHPVKLPNVLLVS